MELPSGVALVTTAWEESPIFFEVAAFLSFPARVSLQSTGTVYECDATDRSHNCEFQEFVPGVPITDRYGFVVGINLASESQRCKNGNCDD